MLTGSHRSGASPRNKTSRPPPSFFFCRVSCFALLLPHGAAHADPRREGRGPVAARPPGAAACGVSPRALPVGASRRCCGDPLPRERRRVYLYAAREPPMPPLGDFTSYFLLACASHLHPLYLTSSSPHQLTRMMLLVITYTTSSGQSSC
ncbi:hypothetical protein EYF80_049031 [Liparis tanakae]|uniref:Uncharacterized protein n=1 Tax=Liparis tanakae TaxID=230148 RepID=A0A4Z2FIL8_9TELE|nr:hypothetical protein EYF80_049031 [Liparis tanakae]